MNYSEVGKLWESNAEAWSVLAREGFDVYRDHFNAPAFQKMLPSVEGLKGLDIGCGEGHNTRLTAQQGAILTAIDISPTFIKFAKDTESQNQLGITYQVASATALPFVDDSFDFAMATMSFMDVPETETVLSEAYRVIKPKGFLQFSICHPCFDTPHRRNLRDENGTTYAIEVGDYYNRKDSFLEWTFSSLPEERKGEFNKFKTINCHRTMSEWLNLLIKQGFLLEEVAEPMPDDETIEKHPYLQDAQVVSYFLMIRATKP